jgi:hypothetical protein
MAYDVLQMMCCMSCLGALQQQCLMHGREANYGVQQQLSKLMAGGMDVSDKHGWPEGAAS